jgi:hypothetical protein
MSPELSFMLAKYIVSAAGVAVLVALAWLLGFRGGRRIGGEQEVRALAQSLELKAPSAVAVDVRGRTALAEIDSDTVLLVKAMGDRLAARTFSRKALAGVRMYRPRGLGIGARLRFSDAGVDEIRIEFNEREAPPFVERLRRGARIH